MAPRVNPAFRTVRRRAEARTCAPMGRRRFGRRSCPVEPAGDPAGEQAQQQQKAEHASSRWPGEVEHGLHERGDGSAIPRAHPVGKAAERNCRTKGHHAGDRHPEPQLRAGEPDDLSNEHRGTGHEGPVANVDSTHCRDRSCSSAVGASIRRIDPGIFT
jgi:hypothetical protein